MKFTSVTAAAMLAFSAEAAPVRCASSLSCVNNIVEQLPHENRNQDNQDNQDIMPILHIVATNGIIYPESSHTKSKFSELSVEELLKHFVPTSETSSIAKLAFDSKKINSVTLSGRSLASKPCANIGKRCLASGFPLHFLGFDYCLPAWFIKDRNFLDADGDLLNCTFTNTEIDDNTGIGAECQGKTAHDSVSTMTDGYHTTTYSTSQAASISQEVSVHGHAVQVSKRDIQESVVTIICKGIAYAIGGAIKMGAQAVVDMFSFLLKKHRHKHSNGTDAVFPTNKTFLGAGLNETVVKAPLPRPIPLSLPAD